MLPSPINRDDDDDDDDLAACVSSPNAPKKQSGFVSLRTWQYDTPPLQVGEAFARLRVY